MKSRTTIGVRLDVPTQEALMAYADANHMTQSQAVRVLLALALRGEQDVEPAFREAAFREGVILGLSRIREEFTTKIQDVVKSALSGMERP